HFGWIPEEIHGEDRVEAITFISVDGADKRLRLTADSVITAIGFQEHPETDLSQDALSGATADIDAGLLDSGLYCAGWFRRGPRGTIPENRADSKRVADAILHAVAEVTLPIGKPGFIAIPDNVKNHLVSYEGWKRIDTEELQSAPDGRVRRKVRNKFDMLNIAQENTPGVQQ